MPSRRAPPSRISIAFRFPPIQYAANIVSLIWYAPLWLTVETFNIKFAVKALGWLEVMKTHQSYWLQTWSSFYAAVFCCARFAHSIVVNKACGQCMVAVTLGWRGGLKFRSDTGHFRFFFAWTVLCHSTGSRSEFCYNGCETTEAVATPVTSIENCLWQRIKEAIFLKYGVCTCTEQYKNCLTSYCDARHCWLRCWLAMTA